MLEFWLVSLQLYSSSYVFSIALNMVIRNFLDCSDVLTVTSSWVTPLLPVLAAPCPARLRGFEREAAISVTSDSRRVCVYSIILTLADTELDIHKQHGVCSVEISPSLFYTLRNVFLCLENLCVHCCC